MISAETNVELKVSAKQIHWGGGGFSIIKTTSYRHLLSSKLGSAQVGSMIGSAQYGLNRGSNQHILAQLRALF